MCKCEKFYIYFLHYSAIKFSNLLRKDLFVVRSYPMLSILPCLPNAGLVDTMPLWPASSIGLYWFLIIQELYSDIVSSCWECGDLT